jgi:glycosyltransferase involved in cell wall biosynthesis
MNLNIGPKISVVTISLNRRDELEATIKSVLAQSYPNIEYLIIDGGSVDGTAELIKQWGSRIQYWVSEKDGGIYDAMNKGVRVATGEWVIFMNAGDRFHDETVVAEIFAAPHDDTDLVYGHSFVWYEREQIKRFLGAEPPAALALGMNCSHQSLFTRRALLLERPFSVGPMVSDYEFLVRMHLDGRRFKLVDRVVSVWTNGGISDKNRMRSLFQRWEVASRSGLLPRGGSLSYLGKGLRAFVAQYLRRILPQRLIVWILRRRKAGQL